MKNKILSLASIFLFLVMVRLQAQEPNFEKGLLWEVRGKKITKPSYIYGTYHLLNEDYLNSLRGWQEKLDGCEVVLGEIVMDSSTMQTVLSSMVMKDNTLDKILSPEEYKKVAVFLKEVSSLDLIMFNNLKPIALSTLLTVFTWAKHNPKDYNPQKKGMDIYFQEIGKKSGKRIAALETVSEQSAILFDSINLERQKEMLLAVIDDYKLTLQESAKLDSCYREQNLKCMLESIYSKEWNFGERELDLLINSRNKAWVPRIVSLIDKQPAFIAVGAGHLPGKNGLLNLLLQKGYEVKQVTLK